MLMEHYEQNSLDKSIDFFKRNIYNIILVFVSIVFIFKDLVQIGETGKTLEQIIAQSTLSFLMGMTFNIILSKKGIMAAQKLDGYQMMMDTYAAELEKTNEFVEYLDDFCETKNNNRIKIIQTRILSKGKISYASFSSGDKSYYTVLDKKQKKIWKKAENVKINYLSADSLLSETDVRYEKGKKELTLREHENRKNMKDAFTKMICAIIFGYFGVLGFNKDFSVILWGAIQISMWLIMGLMSYIQNYTYVKDVYQQKIYRKINLLIEFNKVAMKIKQEKEADQWQSITPSW